MTVVIVADYHFLKEKRQMDKINKYIYKRSKK